EEGNHDLVVIYTSDDKLCWTVAVVDDGSGEHYYTEPTPAPRQNQKIRFFNMDKLGPLEVMITGDKDGQVGYALYRVMDGGLINLYGEGMEDCC
ncbi:MAG: hypothetical protein IJG63_03640, partial [Oscillospiraceae bacterium]|nr:hypothetical protein [Oscillospiraceae bacterium]